MLKIKIAIPQKEIIEFCQRWGVAELSLFGSVLRKDFRSDSDVDVLVTFVQDARISLFDLVKMQSELEAIFHREVDLVEKAGLQNPYRRQEILRTAQRVYAS